MIPLQRHILGVASRAACTRRSSQLASASIWKQRGAPVDVHPEVEDALARNQPVVSLETALVTHGLPYPQALSVPLELEEAVRSTGAIPATIGIVGGRVKIGLEKHELDRLAQRAEKPAKISRRDIGAAIASKSDGGTTCSATLIFSALAGIKVFGTGGLGGVHRGGENSLDISADLQELSRCPVGLVSSGCKSILDIGRTLEYLVESAGVPVVAYGQTKEVPAFFSRNSGHFVPWNTTDPAVAAKMLRAQWELDMNNGMVFAVPIPEQYQAVGEEIQEYVKRAVNESEENGMARSGKDVTPWLLNRVVELSQGKSLDSNIALLKNNAFIAGQIAVQYAKLAALQPAADKLYQRGTSCLNNPVAEKTVSASKTQGPVDIAIVGASALDITAKTDHSVNPKLAPHSTVPGSVALTLGGVARNIAEAATRAGSTAYPGVNSLLVSPVGQDLFGRMMTEEISRLGMRNDGLIVHSGRTSVCNMVLDSEGGLVGGVADMDITQQVPAETILLELGKHTPRYVALDGNVDPKTITSLVEHCVKANSKILFEPTSVYKSTRILPAVASWLKKTRPTQPLIAHITPNLLELREIYEKARSEDFDLMSDNWWWENVDRLSLATNFRMEVDQLARKSISDLPNVKDKLSFLTEGGIAQMAVHLLPFFQHIWIKCGGNGVVAVMQIPAKTAESSGFMGAKTSIAQRTVVAHGTGGDIVVLRHFPALQVDTLLNVTGAGDTFVGALLAGVAQDDKQLYDPHSLESLVNTAQRAACLTLQSHEAVSPTVSDMSRY
ncbi:indigoidine synthase A family protein [Coprinopsis sp. MPI-PUGE-AT-0042]|nr:indigoidine synthase A family protein [Coprinopsis sp. MPI-PUGE-AT-0042]